MTQEMADWIDQQNAVMRACDECIRRSREREEWLMARGLNGQAEAEQAYRAREIAKRDAWARDHEAAKPGSATEFI